MADQEEGVPAPNPPSPSASTTSSTRTAVSTFELVLFQARISGKPDEDAEAHLLYMNNWMNAHHFNKGVKVQRFVLTLLGEVRLWYQS